MGIMRGIRFRELVNHIVNLGWEGRREVVDACTPEASLSEDAHVVAGDDAEVVGTAAESEPEVWVGGGVGGNEEAAGEDDFVTENVVADKAFAGGEEGEAA